MEKFIHESSHDLPIAGECDVIVAGSGPAGVSAAINAGRRGAKVLLLEWNNAVGGISTSGLMSHFTGTVQSKFYTELLQAMADRNEFSNPGQITKYIDPEQLKNIYLELLREAGVTVLLYTFVCGAVMDGNRITGVITESKSGRRVFAEKVFGRQGDHFLTDIEIGIIVVNHEVIDFSGISLTDAISKAIEDAESFMRDGKYDSAFDRVHTAFHGYLRKKLDDLGESYEESDTLNQLYNKLHTYVSAHIATDQSGLIKTTLRSASGVINSINELRNRHSLAHPNDSIITVREAELCIRLVKELSDYIEKVV